MDGVLKHCVPLGVPIKVPKNPDPSINLLLAAERLALLVMFVADVLLLWWWSFVYGSMSPPSKAWNSSKSVEKTTHKKWRSEAII